MTSAITLDFIRDAAERKYGARAVELGDGKTISLINPLRLPKEKREALSDLDFSDSEEPVEYFREAFTLVSSKAEADRICKALGDDPALYMALFEEYMNGTELGEASPSQD